MRRQEWSGFVANWRGVALLAVGHHTPFSGQGSVKTQTWVWHHGGPHFGKVLHLQGDKGALGGDVEWHDITPLFPPGGRPRERVGGDNDEWHDITHLFCRADGFAFLPSRPPAWRACAPAGLWCATVVLRSAELMECKVEGPAPELSRWEVGDDSLLGIQVEEWKRDGVTATARMLPVSQYAWIGLEALRP
jgi:hypothetical protein